MTPSIPLFDSLAHPTLTAKWLDKKSIDASFEALQKSMTDVNFKAACAIGMANIEGYEHGAFLKQCDKYANLIPIAGFQPPATPFIAKELAEIAAMGFKGIKIHPRFSNLNLVGHEPILVKTLQEAAKQNLVVFWCTYMHTHLKNYPSQDPFYGLVNILKQSLDTKVVLVHGGDIQILKYAELVRFNGNLLLDLSLTLQKYSNSSVDVDLQFLFQHFDQRICIGSDFPEYTLQHTRQRFEHFAAGVPLQKQENIAWRNLSQFLGIVFD
ncbi:MAG: amidohydrolase family protein [Chitinophagales bacterium]